MVVQLDDVNGEAITTYIGDSRYHPPPRVEADPNNAHDEPFFASRKFGPLATSGNQSLGLKAISSDIKSFLKVVGQEFGAFPAPTFDNPVEPERTGVKIKRKGGATVYHVSRYHQYFRDPSLLTN